MSQDLNDDYKTPRIVRGIISRIGAIQRSSECCLEMMLKLENTPDLYRINAHNQVAGTSLALTKIGDEVELAVYRRGSSNRIRFKNLTLQAEYGGDGLPTPYE